MAKRNVGHEKHREPIVSAATQLFTARGYDSVSLREIARRAGVHLPAIYWLFADKRELFETCCVAAMDVSLAELEKSVSEVNDPRRLLRAMVATLCESHIRGATKIVHRLLLDNDLEMLRKIAPYLTRSKAFKSMVGAIAAIEPTVNPKLTAFTLFAFVAGFIEHLKLIRMTKVKGVSLATPDEIARHLLVTLFPAAHWDTPDKNASLTSAAKAIL
jgi:AcrR family transcriptional regulator